VLDVCVGRSGTLSIFEAPNVDRCVRRCDMVRLQILKDKWYRNFMLLPPVVLRLADAPPARGRRSMLKHMLKLAAGQSRKQLLRIQRRLIRALRCLSPMLRRYMRGDAWCDDLPVAGLRRCAKYLLRACICLATVLGQDKVASMSLTDSDVDGDDGGSRQIITRADGTMCMAAYVCA